MVRPYYTVSAEISLEDGLLMRGRRIIIPSSLRLELLDKIHTGHQGIAKCRERAKESVWWPGKQLEELVRTCPECCKAQQHRAQPLIPTALPSLPWQKLATDLFEWKKNHYLIIVDYYSRYFEIARLNRMTAEQVIQHTKSIFARHGVPEMLVSDNGPQFASEAFSKFADAYQFEHITSSPYYPQGNGEAERAVQTVKNLLKKDGDPYLALLSYRSTPLQVGHSPAELLMSRKLRTTLPTSREQRKPRVPDHQALRERDDRIKSAQKENHDRHHGVRDLPTLVPGDTIWMPDRNTEAEVVKEVQPRSYEVKTPDGTFRRNRRSLLALPQSLEQEMTAVTTPPERVVQPEPVVQPPATPMVEQAPVRTRSGRVVKPPDRLDPSSNRT